MTVLDMKILQKNFIILIGLSMGEKEVTLLK